MAVEIFFIINSGFIIGFYLDEVKHFSADALREYITEMDESEFVLKIDQLVFGTIELLFRYACINSFSEFFHHF